MIRRNVINVDYDSDLGYPNQTNMTPFTLTLKVFLTPKNPRPGHQSEKFRDIVANTDILIQRWSDAEWTTYKTEFKLEVEKTLNWPHMQLYLLPQLKGQTKMSQIQLLYFKHQSPILNSDNPYVQCGLSIQLVDKKAGAHVAFEVIREKEGEAGLRSYDSQVDGGQDYGTLANRDIDLWTTQSPEAIHQNYVSHEIAHVLGLDHSNANDPECRKSHDAGDICYGKPGTPQYYNLMGIGNQITDANAPPWLKRIPSHAYGLAWSVSTKRPDEIDI